MTRCRVLATASVWAALLAGCGTIKTQTDTLDLLKRCTSKQGPWMAMFAWYVIVMMQMEHGGGVAAIST
jgi:hypothetical protein